MNDTLTIGEDQSLKRIYERHKAPVCPQHNMALVLRQVRDIKHIVDVKIPDHYLVWICPCADDCGYIARSTSRGRPCSAPSNEVTANLRYAIHRLTDKLWAYENDDYQKNMKRILMYRVIKRFLRIVDASQMHIAYLDHNQCVYIINNIDHLCNVFELSMLAHAEQQVSYEDGLASNRIVIQEYAKYAKETRFPSFASKTGTTT